MKKGTSATTLGMLLGWAEHIRRTGGRRHWRWLALSPLVFALLLFQDPGDMLGIVEDGIGGAAIGIPLFAMVGGYALSGRGPRWGRVPCGIVAASMVPIWGLTVESFAGPELVVSTPRGLWVALYLYTFILLLMLASAIPHCPAVPSKTEGVNS